MFKEFFKNKVRNLRVALICVGLVLFMGVSIYSAHVMLNKPSYAKKALARSAANTPSTTHAPAPVMFSGYKQKMYTTPQYSYVTPKEIIPSQPMTSTSMRLHETSNASVKMIGGGSSNGIYTTGGNHPSSNGINSGNLSYGGNMLALSASLALAEPGAGKANEIANTTSQPNSAPSGPRRIIDHEEEWWLTPVGDVPFAIMALLTIAWCVRVRLRKRSACK